MDPAEALRPRQGASTVDELGRPADSQSARLEQDARAAWARDTVHSPPKGSGTVVSAEPVPESSIEFIATGTVLCERYRVLSLLGAGAMGEVYLGEHVEVGRKVAIKVLLAEWSASPEITGRFVGEARTASAIGHPGIIDVFDAGTLGDGRRYLVMEYHEGRDLGVELAERGALAPRRACEIMRQVGAAIEAAHQAGVVHRDLKPDNIMIARRGDEDLAKVLDFGVAADQGRLSSAAATTPGMIIGTPEHMSPEQAIGEAVGPHFDVYALGSTLFTLLAGRAPFEDPNPMKILVYKQTGPPPALGELVPGLPRELVELVDDTLSPDRARRPATAQAFVTRLEDALAALDNPRAAARRAWLPWVAAAAGFVVLATIAALVVSRGGPAEPDARVANLEPDATAKTATPAATLATDASSEPPPRGDDDPALGEAGEPLDSAGDDAPLAERPDEATDEPLGETADERPDEAPRAGQAPGETAPGKAPSKRRPRSAPAHETSECEQVREQAQLAVQAYRWKTVLERSLQRRCWRQARDARKLETQARMEMGDFSGCVKAAKGLQDRNVVRWRELCQKRGGLGP
ncbi:MAG: protein kinase [Myxococcales bacterium]|nr:protein kinase [Myxococcales bacterium]